MTGVLFLAVMALSSARVSDFIQDGVDSTQALQKAFDSGEETVVVDRPTNGVWTVESLFVTNAALKRIVFEDGVLLEAKRGAFRDRNASLLTIEDVDGLIVSGHNALLRMWREDYSKAPYAKGEHRHCLILRNCSNVTVEGLRLEESGGDGIYLCYGRNREVRSGPCRNVTLRKLSCNRNYRQGMSVIGVDGLCVEDCVFSNTKGTPPQSGVDMEPNRPYEIIRNVRFKNCRFEGNQGCGIEFYLGAMNSSSKPVTAIFENCEMRDNATGLKFACSRVRYDDLPRGGSVTIRDCLIANSRRMGVLIQEKPVTGAEMRFENCRIEGWGVAPLVTSVEAWDDPPVGGIALTNVCIRENSTACWRNMDKEHAPKGCSGFDDGLTPQRCPVDYASYRVENPFPREMKRFAGAALTTRSRLVFFADSACSVRLAIEQVPVGGRLPPWRGGIQLESLSVPSRPKESIRVPKIDEQELTFDVPSAGFYRIRFDAVKGAVRIVGANVPVAIDVTTAFQKFYGPSELYAVRRADARTAVIVQGDISVRISDDLSHVLWDEGCGKEWARFLVDPGKGILKVETGCKYRADPSYWKADVSGSAGFLFLTKDRIWY